VEYGYACTGTPSVCAKACGNGVIDGSEGCDDGNTTAGDGCSAFCNVESNFVCTGTPSVCTGACTSATALTLPTGTTPTTANGTFPQGQTAQYFSFTLTQAATVSLQALNGTGGACSSSTPSLDIDLSVYEDDCSTTVESEFSSNCPAMDLNNLAAGTYFVRAKIYPSSATATASVPFQLQLSVILPGCGNSRVEAGEQCDDGNTTVGDGCSDTCQREAVQVSEQEPNDWSCTSTSPITCTFASGAQATVLSGNALTVTGDHSVETDSDVFALDLSQGASVRIEVVEGDASETCESNGIDSKIWLRNSTYGLVLSDDDDGRGFCSLIDGTGLTPADPSASNLAAGRYYVEVNKSSFVSNPADGQFKYNLLIDVR